MDKVLCAIIPTSYIDEQELWMDTEEYFFECGFYYLVPLIDHPHSDRENGQIAIHYHVDTRYFGKQNHLRRYDISTDYRRITQGVYELDYFNLKKNKHRIEAITPVHSIKNSRLKHKCIHKGKCPHRGFDLTNEEPDENGIITCPLHGLKFDKNSKKIINR